MRRALLLVVVGVAALLLQGVAAAFVPSHWVPDIGMLLVIYAALSLGAASGLIVSATLGFATDLLSGALLGQHALLRIALLGVARAANQQLHLHRGLPLAVFVVAVSIGSGVGLLLLTRLFEHRSGASADLMLPIVIHAVVNACVAPAVVRLATRTLSPPDAARRGVLAPRQSTS